MNCEDIMRVYKIYINNIYGPQKELNPHEIQICSRSCVNKCVILCFFGKNENKLKTKKKGSRMELNPVRFLKDLKNGAKFKIHLRAL